MRCPRSFISVLLLFTAPAAVAADLSAGAGGSGSQGSSSNVSLAIQVDITAAGDVEAFVSAKQSLVGNEIDGHNVHSSALIDGSGISVNGIVLINQAPTGQVNQANVVSISAGGRDSAATAFADVEQVIEGNRVTLQGGSASTVIRGDSFKDGSGIVAINQAAQPLNNQFNGIVISFGRPIVFSLSEADLGGVMTGNNVAVSGATTTTAVEDGAFEGFAGIIQVNQSTGVANSSANLIGVGVDFDLTSFGLGDLEALDGF